MVVAPHMDASVAYMHARGKLPCHMQSVGVAKSPLNFSAPNLEVYQYFSRVLHSLRDVEGIHVQQECCCCEIVINF